MRLKRRRIKLSESPATRANPLPRNSRLGADELSWMAMYCNFFSLGYYKGSLKDLRWTPEQLVRETNEYAVNALLYNGGNGVTPPILAKSEW